MGDLPEMKRVGATEGGGDWNENEHPRDEGGKFTSGGGQSAEKAVPVPESSEPKEQGNSLQSANVTENHAELDETSNPVPEDISGLLGNEYEGFKGQQAIDKLLQEKQGHIKAAFHRDDIGDIDLLWGNDDLGLQHIIKRREEQGVDTENFFKDIAEVTEKGSFRKKNDRGNFEFMYNGKVAVVSPELEGNKITFLLTAFKTHSKK